MHYRDWTYTGEHSDKYPLQITKMFFSFSNLFPFSLRLYKNHWVGGICGEGGCVCVAGPDFGSLARRSTQGNSAQSSDPMAGGQFRLDYPL